MAIDDDLDVATPGAGAAKGSSGTGKLLLVSLLMSLLMSGAVGAGVYFLLKNDMAAQSRRIRTRTAKRRKTGQAKGTGHLSVAGGAFHCQPVHPGNALSADHR